MSQLADAFGVGTAQDLADVGDAEPLAGADHGRQDLLGDDGRVELLPGREADVAAPAVFLCPRLAEILQQEFPPTGGQAAELDHAFQLVLRVAPLGLVFDPVDEEVLLPLVAVGVEQHALAGQTVAPGAARLLIVAFERFGQVVVHDQPHVGLVDAHAEGDGRHDDERVVADELFLRLAAQRGVQPGVVGQRGQAHRRQAGRDVLGRLARKAIDDARLAPVFVQQVGERVDGAPAFRAHRVSQVGAVEAGDELPRLRQLQLLGHVAADLLGRRRGQRDERHARQQATQIDQGAVVGPELVAPHRDAVRLVHRHEADMQPRQKVAEAGQRQPLRGDVQDFDRVALHPRPHVADFLVGERAVDERRGNAVGAQGIHLVLHQRDQRRDHQRQPLEPQRRQLVAERFAAARGHQDQGVVPVQHAGDDLPLQRAERVVAEVSLEQVQHAYGPLPPPKPFVCPIGGFDDVLHAI